MRYDNNKWLRHLKMMKKKNKRWKIKSYHMSCAQVQLQLTELVLFLCNKRRVQRQKLFEQDKTSTSQRNFPSGNCWKTSDIIEMYCSLCNVYSVQALFNDA